ncbi:polysaccharide pyruvyl transferase family protein [Rheinheimera sp. D18]|uniref:polysaccharide pyruvyl transferase family protein n=1 Tax=Rheinheimera sp. D18 TaxID=2545632 RepID=UPI001043B9C9|nr:polysaccharide pyruvyl transferase family protein [Rheinheimera sp. D18]QBL09778.1 polysaccharide pyruvyl transferase family protein [Rheinheimera sp. D18]
MMIEVKGVQFVNKGAELMLHAVLQQLQQHWPEADIALAPGPNSPYKARARLAAYQKLPLSKGRLDLNGLSFFLPARLRNWLKSRLGLVTEADIDVVLDVSGFAYSDQWPSALITQLCNEIKRADKHGKKYILLPQAFGPFTRAADISQLKAALPLATLVCAREHTSYQYLRTLLGDAQNVVQYPDFTNLVKADLADEQMVPADTVLIIPNSNMVSSRNKQALWQQTYIPMLQHAIQSIRRFGFTPVLLNHEGAADDAICQQLKRDLDVMLINESDPVAVKGIIASSKAVICSRFHGCVSALSQGVPCLSTSWSHKYERLFEEYQLENCILPPETTPDEFEQKLRHAINQSDSPLLKNGRESLMQRSADMWQHVVELINR